MLYTPPMEPIKFRPYHQLTEHLSVSRYHALQQRVQTATLTLKIQLKLKRKTTLVSLQSFIRGGTSSNAWRAALLSGPIKVICGVLCEGTHAMFPITYS